jgi:hypothetical protein
MSYYDFTSKFKTNGTVKPIPFIPIPTKETDKSKLWNSANDRLDLISNDYYGHPFGDKLILLANADLGLDEFLWENGITIRIPFPYQQSLNQYIDNVNRYINLDGL